MSYQAEREDLHAVDGKSVAEPQKAHNLGLGTDPHLRPLERSLGRGVEEDAADAN